MWFRAWACVWVGIWWAGSSCEGVWLETYRTGLWKVPEDTLHALPISLRFNASDLKRGLTRNLTHDLTSNLTHDLTNYLTSNLTHDLTSDLMHDLTSDLEYGLTSDLTRDLSSNLTRDERSKVLTSILRVTVVPDAEWKLDWVNKSVEFSGKEVLAKVNKSLVFSGYYWGRTSLAFYLTRDDLHPDNNGTLLMDDLEITVDRKSYTVDTIFVVVGTLMVLVNTVNIGAQLDVGVIKTMLMRPVGPICGFVSQFVVMPVATYVMGWALLTDPLERLGLFTVGCCPGGTASNFWTIVLNGNINLSITMTTISTVAAMGMMPLWMFTLGQKLIEGTTIRIPYANIGGSLVAFTIPVGIGILIRLKLPQWADRSAKMMKPFALTIILFTIGVGAFNFYKVILLMTWQMAAAGAVVTSCALILGAALARMVCLPYDMIIAVSLETAIQNPGVAFVLLKLTLDSPNSDFASLPIIAIMCVTAPFLFLGFLIYTCRRSWHGCCSDPTPAKGPEAKQENAREEMLADIDTNGCISVG